MSKHTDLAPSSANVALDIAQRMRAHARLCHQIAIDTRDEHVADEFIQLATEFMEVAAQIEDDCAVAVSDSHRLH